jgi:hypothetical protein
VEPDPARAPARRLDARRQPVGAHLILHSPFFLP